MKTARMQPNLEGIISTLIEIKARTGGCERSRGTSQRRVWGPRHCPNPTLLQFVGIGDGVPGAQSQAFTAGCSWAQPGVSSPTAPVKTVMCGGKCNPARTPRAIPPGQVGLLYWKPNSQPKGDCSSECRHQIAGICKSLITSV